MPRSRIHHLLSLCVAVTSLLPLACAAAAPRVAGEVLVSFKSGASAATMAATQPGIATMKRVSGRVYNIRLQPDATVDGMVAELQGNPLVDRAQPNYIKTLQTSDRFYDQQWGLNNSGQSGGEPGADISVEAAWGVTRGAGAVVAVIDTGLAGGYLAPHPDLQNQLWQNPGEIPDDFDNDGNGIVDDIIGVDVSGTTTTNNPLDLVDGHGTEVAGIIAAEADNTIGIAGVAPEASLMILKAFSGGTSSTTNIVAAIDYAIDNGADIINASYGSFGGRNPGEGDFDFLEYEAIQRAGNAGILFVTAAGNGCTNEPTQPNYDPSCPYSDLQGRGYDNDHPPAQNLQSFVPASYDLSNIIAVAATDRQDALASFSNFGANSVDLAAPGVAIVTAGLVNTQQPDNSYYIDSGTSLAAPFVSGTLALMVSAGDTSAYSLKTRLLASVDSRPSLIGNVASGGRLNAAAALSASPVASPSGGGGGGGALGLLSLFVLAGACRRIGCRRPFVPAGWSARVR